MLVAGALNTALLFLTAGRLDWAQGWAFVILWFITKLSYVALVAKYDPELTAERSARHKNTQTYDRFLMTVYLLMAVATFIFAGLEVRFEGLPGASLALFVIGIGAHLVFSGLSLWAMLANTYHSAESRLQMERGQQVITEGPYRYLRHPTYLAAVILWLTTPLILGSWWALFPAALAGGLMVARTLLEDRMLQRELPGYLEYTQRVRYRLLPGVW